MATDMLKNGNKKAAWIGGIGAGTIVAIVIWVIRIAVVTGGAQECLGRLSEDVDQDLKPRVRAVEMKTERIDAQYDAIQAQLARIEAKL